MKRIIIFMILISVGMFVNLKASSVKVVTSASELEQIVINCHTDYSMIIELPKNTVVKNAVVDKMSKKQWNVDFDFNLVWLQPKYFDSENSILRISVRGYSDILIKLSSVEKKEGLLHTMIIRESALEPVEVKEPVKSVSEKTNFTDIAGKENNVEAKRKEIESIKVEKRADKIFDDSEAENNEHRASLSGGLFNNGDKNAFSIRGEYVGAFKLRHGLITQGAVFVDYNSYQQKYGLSAGVGFEKKNIGAFMFADSLFYKVNDYNTTFALQIRPSVRLTFDNLQVSGFIGIPITSPGFTGITVQENGETLGIYNKALFNTGIQIRAFFDKVYTEFKSILAGKGVYSVTARVGYEILKNIVLTAELRQSSAGEYEYIDGFGKNSSVMVSGRYYFGKTDPVSNKIKKTLIFDPSYPIIVQVKKAPEQSDVNINLVANPSVGYAPLPVEFNATTSGFKGMVTMNWHFSTVLNATSKTTSQNSDFTYNSPGTYTAYVEGTDENGNYAKSNTVTIEVKQRVAGGEKFKITATCSEGGYIQPKGEFFVYAGNDTSVSFGGNNGYGVSKITVDGADVSTLSSPFKFKNVAKDHTIHVEFAAGAVPQYTIVSSVKSGTGTISPEGTTTVNQGTSQKYTISPGSGWSTSKVLVDGESVGVPTEYTFENIKENHVIECEFSQNPPPTYDIVSSSGANGSISPSGTTAVIEGSSITFTITPDEGYEIDELTVDGKSTSPNEGDDKYKFSNVKATHTINATFKRIVLHVTTSVTAGEGTITESADVFWGDDFAVTATPVESNQVKDLVVNGGSVGQVSEITLNQVKSDQTVAVEFEIKKFTITPIVRNNQWGTISPGTVEVEWGTNKSFDFIPEDGHKEVIRYWVNGTLKAKASSHQFTNITEDKTLEVEFDWIYYDVRVVLEKEGTFPCDATLNPGEGWHSFKSGSDPVFECNVNTKTDLIRMELNGNTQGELSSYKIWNINKDHVVTFVIERHQIPITLDIVASGCVYPGSVTASTGQTHTGGGTEVFYMAVDYPITFYFNYSWPPPSHIDHYELTTENQEIINPLPDQYTIASAKEGDRLHVKCVLK